jgi:ElaB/YqjD/DUF883 family membrane-anchored ribosome-binding protein
MGKDASEIRHEIEQTRVRMGETVEALSYKADVPARMRDAFNERAETAKERVADVMNGMRNAAGQAGERMGSVRGDEMRNAARRGMGIAAENPIGLALGAAAVGFLAGLLVPVTDYERRKVPPLRDELLDRAQDVGSDVVAHGKQVVRETAQAALDAAQQSAQSHAQQIADEVIRAPEA